MQTSFNSAVLHGWLIFRMFYSYSILFFVLFKTVAFQNEGPRGAAGNQNRYKYSEFIHYKSQTKSLRNQNLVVTDVKLDLNYFSSKSYYCTSKAALSQSKIGWLQKGKHRKRIFKKITLMCLFIKSLSKAKA